MTNSRYKNSAKQDRKISVGYVSYIWESVKRSKLNRPGYDGFLVCEELGKVFPLHGY